MPGVWHMLNNLMFIYIHGRHEGKLATGSQSPYAKTPKSPTAVKLSNAYGEKLNSRDAKRPGQGHLAIKEAQYKPASGCPQGCFLHFIKVAVLPLTSKQIPVHFKTKGSEQMKGIL